MTNSFIIQTIYYEKMTIINDNLLFKTETLYGNRFPNVLVVQVFNSGATADSLLVSLLANVFTT